MKITDKNNTSPVTTIVRHAILPGKMAAFEVWSKRIRTACRTYTGYLGSEVIKPVDSGGTTVTSIFRFNCYANLETWMQSAERLALLEEASDFSAGPLEVIQYESLEYMFPSSADGKPPSREKMAVVTFAGLVAPVYFVPPLVVDYITKEPILITITSLAIITPLMVYAIMPILTKISASWLSR